MNSFCRAEPFGPNDLFNKKRDGYHLVNQAPPKDGAADQLLFKKDN